MDTRLPGLDDITRLQRSPDLAARKTLATKLGVSYVARLFRARERSIADDIVRAIARDIEVEVREALARSIAASPDLPPDVAIQLANDVIEVAEPILRDSDVLADEALLEVVKLRSEAHRRAIAGRASVSAPLSAAIVDHGELPSVSTLMANPGSVVAEPALEKAVDRFGGEAAVTEPLADRQALPLAIAERLIALVSDRLKARFAGDAGKARRYADGLAAQLAEGAAVILGGGESETLDLMALLDQLKAAGKLQPSLVLRAGRSGERELMHAAVSRLTGRSYSAVAAAFNDPHLARKMLADVGLIPDEIAELTAAAAA
jgi:uncharacterized protein (DUF2336 family)